MPASFDPAVVDEIDHRLHQVTLDHGVTVPWAIESGSRAWGFPSPDSDYDCRFVFVRPFDDYVSLWPKRDVIETESAGTTCMWAAAMAGPIGRSPDVIDEATELIRLKAVTREIGRAAFPPVFARFVADEFERATATYEGVDLPVESTGQKLADDFFREMN